MRKVRLPRRCPEGGWCRSGIVVWVTPGSNGRKKKFEVGKVCVKCKREM